MFFFVRGRCCLFSKENFSNFFRQPCPWDITLSRLRETEIELEEKTKLDHSFVSDDF